MVAGLSWLLAFAVRFTPALSVVACAPRAGARIVLIPAGVSLCRENEPRTIELNTSGGFGNVQTIVQTRVYVVAMAPSSTNRCWRHTNAQQNRAKGRQAALTDLQARHPEMKPVSRPRGEHHSGVYNRTSAHFASFGYRECFPIRISI